MKRYLSPAICAAAMLLSGVSVDAILAPASAQSYASVSFDTFHNQLAPYGDWVYSDRWGEVWTPANVPDDFHPYGTRGHWADTDEYGWTWVSDYEWGDIPFHYGRWVNDPDDGWLWIPGYVWSPGWVVWRSNGQYTGWMPMPPDEDFLGGGNGGNPSVGLTLGGGRMGFSIDFNNTDDNYGYSRWYGRGYNRDRFTANWVFVGTGHMADRDYHRYEAPRANYARIISNTTNTTNYTVVNNYVVNRSVDARTVERASGHPVQQMHVADVIKKPQFITRADTGRDLQMRARTERPRGTGEAGSAPKPSALVVQSLSTKVAPHNGKQPTHLFTRDTVAKAPLAIRPAAVNVPGGVVTAPTNVMGPANETPAERAKRMHMQPGNPSAPALTPQTEAIKGKPIVTAPGNVKVAPVTGPANETPAERAKRTHLQPGNPNAPALTPQTEAIKAKPIVTAPGDVKVAPATGPASETPAERAKRTQMQQGNGPANNPLTGTPNGPADHGTGDMTRMHRTGSEPSMNGPVTTSPVVKPVVTAPVVKPVVTAPVVTHVKPIERVQKPAVAPEPSVIDKGKKKPKKGDQPGTP